MGRKRAVRLYAPKAKSATLKKLAAEKESVLAGYVFAPPTDSRTSPFTAIADADRASPGSRRRQHVAKQASAEAIRHSMKVTKGHKAEVRKLIQGLEKGGYLRKKY